MMFETILLAGLIARPNVVIEENIEEVVTVEQKEEEKKYTVKKGDTLEKIAKEHDTTAERLWAKNTKLQHQDHLEIGDIIVIDKPGEDLEPRLYILPPEFETTPVRAKNGSFSYASNTYGPGFCTWAVKNWRPDIPNGLGNANTWYARYPGAKGSTPQVGAVATTTSGSLGHVALVIGVDGDMVTIKEMNFYGRYVVSTRTVHHSEFMYLY